MENCQPDGLINYLLRVSGGRAGLSIGAKERLLVHLESINTTKCESIICFSHIRLCATPWTVACQAPLSMGFPRQEYWSGVPFPSPGDLPNPGIEPTSSALQADSLQSEPPGSYEVWMWLISLVWSEQACS